MYMTWCAILYILKLIRIYLRFSITNMRLIICNFWILLWKIWKDWFTKSNHTEVSLRKVYLKTIHKFDGKSCNLLLCSSWSFCWKRFFRAVKNLVPLNVVNSRSCTEVIRFASEIVLQKWLSYVRRLILTLSCFQSYSIAFEKFLENILLAYLATVLFLLTFLQQRATISLHLLNCSIFWTLISKFPPLAQIIFYCCLWNPL